MSDGRPSSQGVCPSLVFTPRGLKACTEPRSVFKPRGFKIVLTQAHAWFLFNYQAPAQYNALPLPFSQFLVTFMHRRWRSRQSVDFEYHGVFADKSAKLNFGVFDRDDLIRHTASSKGLKIAQTEAWKLFLFHYYIVEDNNNYPPTIWFTRWTLDRHWCNFINAVPSCEPWSWRMYI